MSRRGRPSQPKEDAALSIDKTKAKYNKSEKGKEARKRYLESEKGKEAVKRQNSTEKARLNRLNYQGTEKGMLSLEKTSIKRKIFRKASKLVEKDSIPLADALVIAAREFKKEGEKES